MKHTFTKLKSGKSLLITSMAVVLLFIGSCKGGGGDDPASDPTPTPTDEMYIILNGQKVICKVPATDYKTEVFLGDTGVTWSGNIPVFSDTTIGIWHYGPRISGLKYRFDPGKIADDIVKTNIRWSYVSTSPYVIVDGGDYTLEKVKGKWVSTLKNGTGYDYRNKSVKYTVAFRMIWPDLK